jgi:hypothetical protein
VFGNITSVAKAECEANRKHATYDAESYIMTDFITYASYRIRLEWSNRAKQIGGTFSMNKDMKNAYKIIRRGCRWEDNIITDLKETGYKGVEWINPALPLRSLGNTVTELTDP